MVVVKSRYLRRFNFKYAVISLISCLLLFNPMAIGGAEDLGETLGWNPYGVMGDVAYAPVRLDGRDLFSIAASRTKGKDDQWGLGTLQFRRDRIEKRLQAQVRYLVENAVDPESLQVITTRLNQQMAVQVVFNGEAAKPIVTVTDLDAEIYGLTELELAEEYARKIREALVLSLQERQPDVQRSQLQRAGIGVAIAALLGTLLLGWQRQIGKVRRRLRQEFQHQQAFLERQQAMAGLDADLNQDSAEQEQLFALKRRIERKTWQKRILQLMLLLLMVVALAWVLQCFPQTRTLGVVVLRQPIGLLLIGLTVQIAIVLSYLLIDWLLTKWVGTEDQQSPAEIERRRRRLLSLAPVLKGVTATLLVIAGLMLAYSLFSFTTGLTLFAGLGVLGLAVSLAFQSSIKDALTGWMFLARDAYTVGDVVAVKDVAGVVERMSLFMTQIRNSAGDLITLRNGEITTVINRSKDWSRMDFTVLVDYETDTKQAMILMQDVMKTMQADPGWGAELIGEPDILGIEQFEQDGILLKIRIQTQPGQQFNVIREFRFRLNQGFKTAGIKIPIPQREVRYRTSAQDYPDQSENL